MGKNVDGESSKSKTAGKIKSDEVLTKVIIRRLPPNFHKNMLLQELSVVFPEGLPDHDYFRFCGSELSFSPVPFARAYINFKHVKDIINFKEKLDGYIFTDGKGGKYPVVVEFAPFQGIPKKTRRRKDIKSATIEKDSDYLSFLETLKQEVEPLPSAEVYLEQQEANKQSQKDAKITTPLIEYMKMKKSSGKSRISSQRPPMSSNEKKRKPPKESGKAGYKNTYPEKGARAQNTSDSSKKGSERKQDSRKFIRDENERKQATPAQSGQKKNEKSRDGKEKGENEEKEKTSNKNRPSSAKTWKESRQQPESQRSGSNASRPSSSYRHTRRGTKDNDKPRSESRPSTASNPSSEKSEERKPQKQQADNKERVRNKDRPAQAIYQPRPRPRSSAEESTPRNSARQAGKEQGRVYRDTPGRDRDNSQRSRNRDYRDNSRRQNRDGQKIAEKSDDTNREQTSGSSGTT